MVVLGKGHCDAQAFTARWSTPSSSEPVQTTRTPEVGPRQQHETTDSKSMAGLPCRLLVQPTQHIQLNPSRLLGSLQKVTTRKQV